MKNVLDTLSKEIAAIAKATRETQVQLQGARRRDASGVFWGSGGDVVVAAHTLERDEGLRVVTVSDEESPAEIVGVDPRTDVALLRTGLERPRPDWADTAEVSSGQLAIVVAPTRVAITGIFANDEEWTAPTGGRIDRYIETDVRRFPGLSGSLLVDGGGRAIGMNTTALARRRSLTIPGATLTRVVDELREHGSVRRGYLGVTTYPVRVPGDATPSQGLLLLAVQPDSPAEQAGLLLGDVLLGIEGELVESPTALLTCLGSERIDQEVEARVLRAGEETTLRIRIGARADS